jgi:hypothetical protein
MINNSTYQKTVKQYGVIEDKNLLDELLFIMGKCVNVKNYIFSRYSGVGSILLIKNSRKYIRNEWTNSGFIDDWSINRRFVRNSIESAIPNIKSNWSNLKNKIRPLISKNENFNDVEKHYLFTILKSDTLLYQVLNCLPVNGLDKKFDDLDKIKLNKFLSRIIRNKKSEIPRQKSMSMMIDNEMYSYKGDYLLIMGLVKGQRIPIKINTKDRFTGNLIIKYNPDRNIFSIHKTIEPKVKENTFNVNEIGVDKNFINVLDTSSENSYGEGLNKILTTYTNHFSEKNKKRQPYHVLIKELKNTIKNSNNPEEIKTCQQKINNINKFNLGKKKYNKKQNSLKEEVRKITNSAINKFIDEEKPTLVFIEDLTFQSKGGKKYNKKVKLLLTTWTKGLVRERMDYKFNVNSIEKKEINPAYTSQVCCSCDHFGERKNDLFYCLNEHCSNKGVPSGYNAAKMILGRGHDNEIILKMNPKKVRAIIEKRQLDNVNSKDSNRNGQDLVTGAKPIFVGRSKLKQNV